MGPTPMSSAWSRREAGGWRIFSDADGFQTIWPEPKLQAQVRLGSGAPIAFQFTLPKFIQLRRQAAAANDFLSERGGSSGESKQRAIRIDEQTVDIRAAILGGRQPSSRVGLKRQLLGVELAI